MPFTHSSLIICSPFQLLVNSGQIGEEQAIYVTEVTYPLLD